MNMMVRQYQQRILGPTEPVDYSNIVMSAYPPQAIQLEPFIGFKALMTDTQAFVTNPAERLRYLDANLGFLQGKGCLMRETNNNKPDGFWVMTLPVPRSQVSKALTKFFDVLQTLEQYFGIVKDGCYEINVSGKCHVTEVERCFSGLVIPQRYNSCLIPSNNFMCSIGNIQRINDNYMCLRTRWNLNQSNSVPSQTFDDLIVISQMIASMY